MSYLRFEDFSEQSWAIDVSASKPFTPKTLIEREDQVLHFA
jgi:hypothetical protein